MDILNFFIGGRWPRFVFKWNIFCINISSSKASLASPSLTWAWHSSAPACSFHSLITINFENRGGETNIFVFVYSVTTTYVICFSTFLQLPGAILKHPRLENAETAATAATTNKPLAWSLTSSTKMTSAQKPTVNTMFWGKCTQILHWERWEEYNFICASSYIGLSGVHAMQLSLTNSIQPSWAWAWHTMFSVVKYLLESIITTSSHISAPSCNYLEPRLWWTIWRWTIQQPRATILCAVWTFLSRWTMPWEQQ